MKATREEIINELSGLEYNGKASYKSGCLAKIKSLDDKYLNAYYEMFHKYEYKDSNPDFNYGSFDGYRSKISNFLKYCQNNNIEIEKFSQVNLINYCEQFKKYGTLNGRKSTIERFLKRFSIELDYAPIAKKLKELRAGEASAVPLTSKQIEEVRYFYRNDKFKLFVFEWLYSLKLNKNDFDKFSLNDFDSINSIITINDEPIKITPYIYDLIISVMNDKRVSRTKSTIEGYLNVMELELIEEGIIKSYFRDMDIKATAKNQAKDGTYNICPECGRSYESIAENWVIKTYDNSNTKWIVCKEFCGKVNDE